jgi:predicted adenylyl cyclase CyaB
MEIELKFRVPDPEPLRARLRQLGFRVHVRRQPEANWIFDDSRASLRRHGRLLRLRQSGTRWLLTVKGPRLPGPLKRRAEAETGVADGPACRCALEALGYHAQLVYRRYRTVFNRAGAAGELAWDETPMGVYLELEGSAAWVRRTAKELGFAAGAAEPRSYPELYAAPSAAGSGRAGGVGAEGFPDPAGAQAGGAAQPRRGPRQLMATVRRQKAHKPPAPRRSTAADKRRAGRGDG